MSVIIVLRLNEMRLDFFQFFVFFFTMPGLFESSLKKKLLGYTRLVLRLIPNMAFLSWDEFDRKIVIENT